MASFINSKASLASFIWGAKPPSSPTPHNKFLSFRTFFKVLNTSEPILRFSWYSSLFGTIINSWKSRLLLAWTPPFKIFIIHFGILYSFPKYSYNSKPLYLAAAFRLASETPNMALAPSTSLFSVPSFSNMILSISSWFNESFPINNGFIILLTLFMAFNTPLPWYLFLSLSLSSNASFLPVDAPLGTDATAFIPDSRVNSTSTVGLPLESNISLAYIFFILLIFSLHINYKIL